MMINRFIDFAAQLFLTLFSSEKLSKTKVIVLTKNYRSTQEILDRSHDLIEHNNRTGWRLLKNRQKISVKVAKDGEEIHLSTLTELRMNPIKLQKESRSSKEFKYQYKDFAILVRANNHSEPIMRALGRNGIPFQFLGHSRLLNKQKLLI